MAKARVGALQALFGITSSAALDQDSKVRNKDPLFHDHIQMCKIMDVGCYVHHCIL